jgi:hypothetical protein
MSTTCCLYIEETVAWIIGWFDGAIIGCIYPNPDEEELINEDFEIINEVFKGGSVGFINASRIRNINK